MRAKRVFQTLKAGVARGEVVLLLVAGAVGNVRLAVDAEIAAVGIEDGDGVEVGPSRALEKADRQHHGKLACDAGKVPHRRVVRDRARQREVPHVLLDAEIRRLEQLRQQDDVRAGGGRLAHQPLGTRDVRLRVPAAGHLNGRHRHRAGGTAKVLRLARHQAPRAVCARRSASERCTCSVMRIAVSSAMSPASPVTTGGRPLRMQLQKRVDLRLERITGLEALLLDGHRQRPRAHRRGRAF